MPDNQLFQPLMIQQPDPQQPSPADAWTANTKLLTDYLDQQQAQAQQQGLWTGGQVWEGGHPTGAGVVNAAGQYGSGMLMGTTAPGVRAFHGSPYDFNAFDASKIGTGEGAQAYGHGLYFAGNEAVAKGYRDALAPINDLKIMPELQAHLASEDNLGFDTSAQALAAIRTHPDWAQRWDVQDAKGLGDLVDQQNKLRDAAQGHMYEVNIGANPAHFLDWDKPLSQQSQHVQDAVQSLGIKGDPTGAQVHATLQDQARYSHPAYAQGLLPPADWQPPREGGAKALADAGIPGIRYLDQQSRLQPGQVSINQRIVADAQQRLAANPNDAQAAKELASAKADLADWEAKDTTSNHVVFDPATIEILRKYGIAGLIAGGGAAAATQQGQPPT